MAAKKEPLIIYYNARCSKCREAKANLEARKLSCQLVEYINTPPTVEQLQELLLKLNAKPKDILRSNEPLWQEQFAHRKLSGLALLKVIAKHPVLLQRPIVVKGDKAWIARSEEALSQIK